MARTTNDEIKEILKQRRLDLGLTMKEVANKVGVSEGTISRWESGIITEMRRDRIMSLATALQLPPGVIAGWEDYEQPVTSCSNIHPINKRTFPLFDGIAAGEPILMPDGIECYVESTTDLKADFVLRVHGDSMIGARIQDGDLVFIRSQPKVENGQIAAIAIDDEATLKRFYYDEASQIVTLVAENPAYPPMVFSADAGKEVKILGKAVAFQSDVR